MYSVRLLEPMETGEPVLAVMRGGGMAIGWCRLPMSVMSMPGAIILQLAGPIGSSIFLSRSRLMEYGGVEGVEQVLAWGDKLQV